MNASEVLELAVVNTEVVSVLYTLELDGLKISEVLELVIDSRKVVSVLYTLKLDVVKISEILLVDLLPKSALFVKSLAVRVVRVANEVFAVIDRNSLTVV